MSYHHSMAPTEKRPNGRKRRTLKEQWSTETAITVNTLSVVAQPEYVAWIDLMGAKSWMSGSIRRAAEMIGLIHIAGLAASRKYKVKAYPVIDGIYLIGKEKKQFSAASRLVMRTLVATFMAQEKPDRRFLVRGGIAYGRVLHGVDIAKLHNDLKSEGGYSVCLALGISIGQAYAAEGKAPPFGYYVDSTARSTASVAAFPYTSAFFRWWSVKDEWRAAKHFGDLLDTHFEYLKGKRRELEYPIERLEEHQGLAREYFQLTTNDITLRKGADENS